MQNDKKYPPILDCNRYTLFTENPGDPTKKSRLQWGISNSNPRISVFTNDEEKNLAIIGTNVSPEIFLIILNMIKETALSEPGTKQKVEFIRTDRQDETVKYVSMTFFAGKDEKGIVWVSLIDKNKPKIKFNLKLWDFNKVYDKTGEPVSESKGSEMYALSLVEALKGVYAPLMGEFASYQGSGNKPAAKKPSAGLDSGGMGDEDIW